MEINETYKLECKQGHQLELSASELEEALEWASCPECSGDIVSVSPREFQVECVACTWEETNDWESIAGWLFTGCPRCGPDGHGSPVHIVDSFYHHLAMYDEYAKKTRSEAFVRPNRPDYWELVIHFCTRDELLAILRDSTIKASPTGYYNRTGATAVCLSEVPLIYSSEIRQIHGDYGIGFRKSEILKYGGQPAIYLNDQMIRAQEVAGGFAKELKPMITLVRTPSTSPHGKLKKLVNFLHEREWRVPRDIDLKVLPPVGLVLPPGHSSLKFAGQDWEELMEFSFQYGELEES